MSMSTARERVQSLDDRLRELEQRFISVRGHASEAVPSSQHGRDPQLAATVLEVPAQEPRAPLSAGGAANVSPAAESGAQGLTLGPAGAQVAHPLPRLGAQAAGLPPLAPVQHPSRITEVPLRLYRQGLPHRELGPPQSVWEADKNAAVLALSDRVHQLEGQLASQQQDQQRGQPQEQAGSNPDVAQPMQPHLVMPAPPIDLLPVPRTVLGNVSTVSNPASYDGMHAGGMQAAPVKYYPPSEQPTDPASRLLAAAGRPTGPSHALGPQGHTRAFAASVTASAAATVPSVMMARARSKENAGPMADTSAPGHQEARCSAEQAGCGGASDANRCSSVGVSAPLGHARAAAIAAASLHTAALRESSALQPAGPYPMVAAALAVGTPGTGGSTWEQGKMRALLSLEQEREALRAQVEAYRDQDDRHRRQMVELNERHREDLRNAAGVAGAKLDRLMSSAWQLYVRRLLVLRVSRALAAWRRIAARNKRLAWAQRVWRRRALEACFTDWHMLVMAMRQERQARRRATARYARSVLLAWLAAASEGKRLERIVHKVVFIRCRWLLAAWSLRCDELRAKRRQVNTADAHRRARLLRRGWRGLSNELKASLEAAKLLETRLRKGRARTALQTWVRQTRLGRRLDAMHRRAVLRCSLRSWAAHASRRAALRRKQHALEAVWRRRRQARLLAGWAVAARRLAQLGTAEAALRAAVRRELLSGAWTSLRLAVRERTWTRRCAATVLLAWRSVAQRASRIRRLVLLRQLQRNRTLLASMLAAWRLQGKARSVQQHVREIHRLQELEPMYEHQIELVRQDRGAAQTHMRALAAEANLLRAELLRGFVMSAEGGLLGKPLRWRSMPADPDQWCPPPRSRHSALMLRGLQLPQAPVPSAAGAVAMPGYSTMHSAVLRATGVTDAADAGGDMQMAVPGVAGVLLVFGGVNEEIWFRDLHALEVTYSDAGAATFRWHEVEVLLQDEAPGAPGGLAAGAGPDAGGMGGPKLPLPTRRDHAACVTSPNQFVIVGGFDGSTELMDIHAVTVRAAEDSAGWAAEVRAVTPRNRTPPGRSHHSVTLHGPGRSLLVFGGYVSARGHLGELWVYHLDHHEWWQPNTTGDAPPPRRNHVAALVGGRLYLHGGFNGSDCLGDTWVLDAQQWHWTALQTTGPGPSPRRGHAAEVVDDRYLVLHGGYDGAGQLADGWVLDTHTAAWWALAAAGGPEDMPTPRAHHSLTVVGHVLVALGGAGPLGPLRGVHLLESPALVGGLAQAHRLMGLAAQLSVVRAGAADTGAALMVTRHRADLAEQQLGLLRERSSHLLDRHNSALADMERLKSRLAAEQVRCVAAEARAADAALALATAERRLRRTREGGQEVAAAAHDMHDTILDLREEVARLRGQLLSATQQQGREASQLSALSAERGLLHHQLAGAQQEAALLRGMLATSEAEFRAALDRQRAGAEAELAAAAEHAKQLVTAAAAAASGSAAQVGTADLDLVVLQQLATATARAETAELRLHALERDHGGLQAELATLKRHMQQQRAAREAAEERATAAMQHMHASELRYLAQIEDLQRQVVQAQQERWRADLGLPHRKQPQLQQQQPERLPAAPPPAQQEATASASADADGRADAEKLLLSARPPPDPGIEAPSRKTVYAARASVVMDPMDPRAHFTVQHIEKLVVEDPALDVLPEVARLLQLQRRLSGAE